MRKLRLTLAQAEGNPCPELARDAQFVYVDGDSECWVNYRASLVKRKPEESGRAAWGPAKWEELHRWAMRVDLLGKPDPPYTLEVFSHSLPCGDCTRHWLKLLEEMPPDFSSNDALFDWTVRAHNAVNRRLAKPEMSVDEARAKWCECGGKCECATARAKQP
jgi:hypothetical protein